MAGILNPTSELAVALAAVQAELPKIERDRTVTVRQKNGDEYSYSYVTLANLSDAILPLLAKNGLAWACMPGLSADGKMAVRYRLLHKSGESLDGEFPISGEGGIQQLGGKITYVRRYCLAAIVGVAADEDDESRLNEDGPRSAQRAAAAPRSQTTNRPPASGQTAQRRERPAASRPPLPGENADPDSPVGQDQHRHMRALWAELGVGSEERRQFRLNKMATWLGLAELESSSDLTRAQADQVIAELKAAEAAPGSRSRGGGAGMSRQGRQVVRGRAERGQRDADRPPAHPRAAPAERRGAAPHRPVRAAADDPGRMGDERRPGVPRRHAVRAGPLRVRRAGDAPRDQRQGPAGGLLRIHLRLPPLRR
jgi:hypothetical protein